jgi:TetR/AcrR family transcriptional repressor of nem operon
LAAWRQPVDTSAREEYLPSWLINQSKSVTPHATRTRLVSTAMKLFSEKGYGSTSVADLLQAADINSGSLYNFFPGKQDLLLAVLDAYRSGIREMLLLPAWQGVTDPIEKVFSLLARYRGLIVETDCFYGCPIGSLALELHEPDPAVGNRLAANFAVWIDAVQECLVEAGSRLPDHVDRRALAEFVLTTMEGAVMLTRTFRDVAYFDSAVKQLRGYFDSLLVPPRPSIRRKTRRSKTIHKGG